MSNKALLMVIAVLLFGIFGMMIFQVTEGTPAEKTSQSMSGTLETVNNELKAELN